MMKISKEVIWSPVEGELVLMNFTTGEYHGLNAVGSFIWKLLADGLALPAIIESVQATYDVDAATATKEVHRLISELVEAKLLAQS